MSKILFVCLALSIFNSPAFAATPTSLLGTWSSGCLGYGQISNVYTVTFGSDGNETQFFAQFAGNTCEPAKILMNTSSVDPIVVTNNSIAMNYSSDQSYTTYFSADLVGIANANSACGSNNWAIGVQETHTQCINPDQLNGFETDTFTVAGNTLTILTCDTHGTPGFQCVSNSFTKN